MERQRQSLRRPMAAGFATAGSVLLLLGGCASPGVPRPPSLHLPALVRSLQAERVGNKVTLHFVAPDQTTDRLPLVHKGKPVELVAVVCRVQGASCLDVARNAVKPGEAVDVSDNLPPALTVGSDRAVGYRVRVSNPAGRDAGLSRPALAAAGVAPQGVNGLRAKTTADGIEIRWQPVPDTSAETVRVEATTESAPGAGPAFGKPPEREGVKGLPQYRVLQTGKATHDPGGAIDPAPPVGARVLYRVYRQRTFTADGVQLTVRGEPGTVQATRSADVFAPAAPAGLLSVAFTAPGGTPAVSLSWDPGTEPDVVGYRIYRASGSGAFVRLNQALVTGVSYQDSEGLRPGMHVRYTVAAVDRSGNESARSAVTEADVH